MRRLLVCKWDRDFMTLLKKEDIEVYLVVDQYECDHCDVDLSMADVAYKISSFNSLEELMSIVVDLREKKITIDKVVNFIEHGQLGASLLKHFIEKDSNILEKTLTARDKRLMKAVARSVGVTVARSCSVADLDTELSSATAVLGYPFILKPAYGIGAYSTYKIKDHAELNKIVSDLKTNGLPGFLSSQHFIAEEFINGEEFHIDAIWKNGQEIIFSISRYFCPRIGAGNRNLNGSIVLPESQYESLYREAREVCLKISRELDFRNEAVHIEFFIEKNSGKFILSEFATRIAGAAVSDSIEYAKGSSLHQLLLKSLLGDENTLDSLNVKNPPHDTRFVGWCNIIPAVSGKINKMPEKNFFQQYKNIFKIQFLQKEGDLVNVDDPSNWCILIVLGADSEQGIVDTCNQILSDIKFEMIPS
ncbi:MAG: ATP-grasp domain-containing protein [Oligoflexia bacterium]|nr:ATP-grasp domain-containing protein [Oligoflexia bacterium]